MVFNLENEQPEKKIEIPPALLQGLQKIESSGVVPLLIPQVLEDFLTKQGIYRSSMTPADAWEALQQLYAETRPAPAVTKISEPATIEETEAERPEPLPASEQAQPRAFESSPAELEQRLRQEIILIGRRLPTARISLYRLSQSVYSVVFRQRQRRGRLTIYLTCGTSYPQKPPQEVKIELEQPGRATLQRAYHPKIFDRWQPDNSLLEIIAEVLEAV